jgi:drug/metabolite transporter (DMT)-like permease
MRAAGAFLILVGMVILLAGVGMDTTRTTTTCYEADYEWDPADSSGCIETTYSNPAPKFAALMLGFLLLVGGGVVWSRSEGSHSSSHGTRDVGPRREIDDTDEPRKTMLVDELREREDEPKSDSNEN